MKLMAYHSSIRAEGSVSSKSLFSEAGSVSHGQPQPSALASKRPRFNVSIYGSPVLTPRAQVKAKAAPQSIDDGGLSQAARRILESLEQMSTPISDAKRIPTPTPGHRGSFLDSSYTAALHRHRPPHRPSAPPSSKLLTPSKAAAESTKFLPSSQPSASVTSSSPPQDVFKFGVSSSSSASMTFEFTPKPSNTAFSSGILQSSKGVGKMKSRVVDSGRSSIRHEEEVMEESTLTPVPLSLSSLPKINFTVSSAGQNLQTNLSSSPEGFRFSIPEIVDVQSTSETLDNAPKFTFRNPTLISEGNTPSSKAAMASPPQLMFNSSSSSFLVPKLKTNSKKDVTSTEKLKEGSILEILKPKGNISEKSMLTLSPSNGEKTVVTSKAFSVNYSESTKSVLEQPVNSVVKKTDTLQGVKGFGSMFKQSSDEWECSVCMLRNKNASVKCLACETQRPGQITSAPSKDAVKGAVKSCESLGESGSAWGDAFKKSASEWECDMCMVRNKNSVSKCVACETSKPGSKPELKGLPDMAIDTKEKTNTTGFGSAFAKQNGEWECDTCLVRNKSDATKCISCETPKPGAANVSEAITGNFKFGVNTAASDLSSVGSTIKFGLSNSQTEKAASSGFNFGVGAKSMQEKENQGNQGFKFGVPAEKSNAFTVHSYGSSTESEEPKNKAASSSVAYSFGVQKTDTKGKEKAETTTKPLFFGDKTSDSVESVTSTTPAVQFSAGTKTHGAFSFDRGTQDKAKEDTLNTSNKDLKMGVSEEVKISKTNELHFDTKAGSTEGNITKPSFTFNSVTTSNRKEDDTCNTVVASPFGLLTNRNPTLIVATTATPAATSTATLADPFGAVTSGANTSSSGSMFAFGDKASNPNAFPSFSFTSPQLPVSKEENKTTLAFSFGSKVDSSETKESDKKLSFASSPFAPAINNGVSAPSSLFTFGSKENKLGSGSGFGAPPSSTPAFGAPAPSNATPAFQFGNSNPPARAATAPSAFGNPAPAFGSSVNSSSPGFAFGQPTEKKSSAGFDFGQAASNTGSAFNFSATVPQSSAPALFQFGQDGKDRPLDPPANRNHEWDRASLDVFL
ncbi:Nuclear pore complex protein Nup153 [Chionoecetes opilio]|uniref:Nuclear pore complex protein Nup153 n=1 Tax=Chionoecetes opilio TaxID=41210 RepID=A0A8J4YMB1_CHIOP|nr:Nuclear pore complex protein Nup153 [Chionoecetes opilio]